MKGTVKFFNEMKGFGFITAEDGKDYFFHKTGVKAGITLHENDSVSFDLEEGDRGPKAVNVERAKAKKPEPEEKEPEEKEPEEKEPEIEEKTKKTKTKEPKAKKTKAKKSE